MDFPTYHPFTSINYNNETDPVLWEPFARLVLDASYEATLLTALQTGIRHNFADGSGKVFLTLVGGGVFGNSRDWIIPAIVRAMNLVSDQRLQVHLVHHEVLDEALVQRFEGALKDYHPPNVPDV